MSYKDWLIEKGYVSTEAETKETDEATIYENGLIDREQQQDRWMELQEELYNERD